MSTKMRCCVHSNDMLKFSCARFCAENTENNKTFSLDISLKLFCLNGNFLVRDPNHHQSISHLSH